MNKLLLHCCCGPCSVAVFDHLREQQQDFIAFFYNPNIHPYQEYRARRDAWRDLCQTQGVDMLCRDADSLEEWLAAVAANPAQRCAYCYRLRLAVAAQTAKENGCDAFSSTLLISPYQDRERILTIGQEEAARFGLDFIAYDFRPLFRSGQQKAREMGLYMQKYCGCIYSEKERFYKKKG